MIWLVTQFVWFGLATTIMVVDRRLMDRSFDPAAVDNVDLRDRSPGLFLGLGLIFGGLVLPFYLWHSRRSAAAVVAGVGLMFACAFIVGTVRVAMA